VQSWEECIYLDYMRCNFFRYWSREEQRIAQLQVQDEVECGSWNIPIWINTQYSANHVQAKKQKARHEEAVDAKVQEALIARELKFEQMHKRLKDAEVSPSLFVT
jgi:hypothetical protein